MQRNGNVLSNDTYEDEGLKLAKLAQIGLRQRLEERKPLPKSCESLDVHSVEWFQAWMRRCPGEAIADADVTADSIVAVFSTNAPIRCRINFQKHPKS
eukprot:311443-Amphidinium_carterae.1